MRLNCSTQKAQRNLHNSRTTRVFFAGFALLIASTMSGCGKPEQTEAKESIAKRAEPDFNSREPRERMRAVRENNDTLALVNWGALAEFSDVRLACVEKLVHLSCFSDLLRIYSETRYADTKEMITKWLAAMVDELDPENNEKRFLAHIAIHSKDGSARRKAIQKLNGYIEELANIAIAAEDKETGWIMLMQITSEFR